MHADIANHLASVDRLRDAIMSLTGHGEGDDMDWSVMTQQELFDLGKSDGS